MFTRHMKPSPALIQERRDRHYRQLSLIRVRTREEEAELLSLECQPVPQPEEDELCSPAIRLLQWLRMAK